jgi:hypothetical protein
VHLQAEVARLRERIEEIEKKRNWKLSFHGLTGESMITY